MIQQDVIANLLHDMRYGQNRLFSHSWEFSLHHHYSTTTIDHPRRPLAFQLEAWALEHALASWKGL